MVAASWMMGSAAYADGDDVPSTWMLPPSVNYSPHNTPPPSTNDPNDTQAEEVGGATVGFAVRNEGGDDIAHARVLMDGQILVGALDGWAVTIPPGEHLFEFAGAGYVAQEHMIVVHAGTNALLLTVTLKPVEIAEETSPVVALKPRAPEDLFKPYSAPETPSDPWMVTYVAAGTSIVSLGIGTALGVSASNQIGTLRTTCAPNCTSDQVNSVSTEMTAADVALGIGLVSGAVAVVWAVTHPRGPSQENKPSVGMTVRGFAGTF
jgi:hypothetical protein